MKKRTSRSCAKRWTFHEQKRSCCRRKTACFKPLIRRHKMLAEGLDTNPHAYDRDIYFYSLSQAFAHNDVKIWAWRFYTATEFYRAAGSERLATEQMEGDIKPDDKWTRETLIFGKEYGLIRKFPR